MAPSPLPTRPGSVLPLESSDGRTSPPSTAQEVPVSATPLPGSPHQFKRSCELCRHRRVKCDRQQPCSNCIRSKADCVYPSGRGRAPKTRRRALDSQLVDRLSHLETLLRRLKDHPAPGSHNEAAEFPFPPPLTSGSNRVNSNPSIEGQFGRLMIDESRSYYVSNVLWASLVSEIDELRGMLLEPVSEDEDEYGMLGPEHSSLNAPSQGLNALMFGFRAITYSMQPFHPSPPMSGTLFSFFAENVAPLIRIFHMPTLSRAYYDATASLNSLDKNTEALLFAIYYSAIVSITPAQCFTLLGVPHSAASDHYRFAAEQALARANLLTTQSITLVQAATLFISALRNHDDSRATWSLTALVFHIAQAMGLHRDGALFGLRPFDTEIRRRLWWQICILDRRGSEYHGYEPIVAGGERGFDTRMPLHINDGDLEPDMEVEPTERWGEATDMTLPLVRCEAMRTGWKFRHDESGEHRAPMNMSERIQFLEEREDLVRELEQRLQEKYLRHCDNSVPYQLVSTTVARLVIARFWLIVHYQPATKSGEECGAPHAPDLNTSMRDQYFSASIEILELCNLLLTHEKMSRWGWYAKTHIQWHTVAFVLSELCSRPPSQECDRAWNCITAVYDAWKTNGSEKDTLSVPIRRLMARARYVRQMQQVDVQRGDDTPTANMFLHASNSQDDLDHQWSSMASAPHVTRTDDQDEDASNRCRAFEGAMPGILPGWLSEMRTELYGRVTGDGAFPQTMGDETISNDWSRW